MRRQDDKGLLTFYLGEAYRRRDAAGDDAKAAELYARAIALPGAPAGAWREHGFALRNGRPHAPKRARRLQTLPAATHRRRTIAPSCSASSTSSEARTDASMDDRPQRRRGVRASRCCSPPAPRGGRAAWCSRAEVRAGKLELTIDARWNGRAPRPIASQLWTIDGELLNLLYLIHTVKRARLHLPRPAPEQAPAGWRRTTTRGMRADELRDLVADGLLSAGMVGVHATNLRPGDFGGARACVSTSTLTTSEGLAVPGPGRAAFEHEQGPGTGDLHRAARVLLPARRGEGVEDARHACAG